MSLYRALFRGAALAKDTSLNVPAAADALPGAAVEGTVVVGVVVECELVDARRYKLATVLMGTVDESNPRRPFD